MQTSVPDLMRLSPRSLKAFCRCTGPSQARRRSPIIACWPGGWPSRDVRFVQLYHRDWDHHGSLPTEIKKQCDATDRSSAALVADLKQRGLLDSTLVIWGGEFGRTAYSQGKISPGNFGRDHHPPACFSLWMAGGGDQGWAGDQQDRTISAITSSRMPFTSTTSRLQSCISLASITPS